MIFSCYIFSFIFLFFISFLPYSHPIYVIYYIVFFTLPLSLLPPQGRREGHTGEAGAPRGAAGGGGGGELAGRGPANARQGGELQGGGEGGVHGGSGLGSRHRDIVRAHRGPGEYRVRGGVGGWRGGGLFLHEFA